MKTPKPKLLFLLDYDGTLTDFSKDPEQSRISPSIRALLYRLRRKHPVILISGRYVKSLIRVSGLRGFSIVGTHGFEADRLPGGLQMAPIALRRKFKGEAAALWRGVKVLLRRYPGIHIERKPFSSTLHYRGSNLSPAQESRLHRDFHLIFRKTVTKRIWTLQDGKKMIEAMPKGFSKGRAVRILLNKFPGYLPIYVGDDISDFSAFKALGKLGLRVAVGNRVPRRYYDLRFDSPPALVNWLKTFADE
jgi:trehalose-phosphatase